MSDAGLSNERPANDPAPGTSTVVPASELSQEALATDQKYRGQTDKVYMSLTEARDLSRVLAWQVGGRVGKPDLVVGLANGANFTTKVLADELGSPFTIIKVRRKGSRIKRRLGMLVKALRLPPALLSGRFFSMLINGFDRRFSKLEEGSKQLGVDVAGKTVVIVDDCVDTGASLKYIVEKLRNGGAKSITTAVLCWSNKHDTAQSLGVTPDLFLHRRIHYYPWSNNSPYFKEFLAWSENEKVALWS